MDILQTITQEFNLNPTHAKNILSLIDEGNTIPFIARYRKEMTGSCDDQVLRALSDRLTYLRNLEKRKEEVSSAIGEQGKLTDEIKAALEKAVTLPKWRIFTARISRSAKRALPSPSQRDFSRWRTPSSRRIKLWT